MKYRGPTFAPALSGGGFRATLFHLGTIRFLSEIGALNSTVLKQISAVSGGSVLAAHLVLNWEKYQESTDSFDMVARAIVEFVRRDVRGGIVRKWIFGCATYFPRFWGAHKRKWSLGNLLQFEYAKLYGDAPIESLRKEGRPKVRFHCTSLTSGDPCYFNETGFVWNEKSAAEPIPSFDLTVAFAVAASSAFPPLFPPIEISHENLSCDAAEFPIRQRLTDGGVYDNLGIDTLIGAQNTSFETIVMSDAEGNFDSDVEAKFSFPVTRNIRASDLLMKRVSVLRLSDLDSDTPPHVRIKIKGAVEDLMEPTTLTPDAQRALINVRTDLDAFSDLEIAALISHGFCKARESFLKQGLVEHDAPRHTWDPLGNLDGLRHRSVSEELRRSRTRRWRVWSRSDPLTWATSALLCFICLLLAAPTVFLYLRSVEEASKAQVAQQGIAIAQANAIAADIQAGNAGVLLTNLTGGISSKWQLKGAGDCPEAGVGDSSEGQYPVDQKCSSDGKAKSAVCWDGITFSKTGNFKYPAAWCSYVSASTSQCKGGTNPGRAYECIPNAPVGQKAKKLSVCVGDDCPTAATKLSCGTSVQNWAEDQCESSAVTRVSSKGGAACATDVYEIACVGEKATPPKITSASSPSMPPPAKSEVTRPIKICIGEYERSCDAHDVYLYCYQSPEDWGKRACDRSQVIRLNSRGGNKCGYGLFEVLCTSQVK